MSRPSGRAVALGLALIMGTAGGTAIAFRLTAPNDGTTIVGAEGPSGTPTTGITDTAPAVTPSTSTSATAPPTTLPPSTLVAPSPSRPASPESADPKSVARNFALAYLSWRWDGQPNTEAAVRAACRPWDTDVLDAQLATSSGGGTFTAARIAAHEVSTASIINLDPPDPQTERTARYLALVTVTTTRDGQPPSKRAVYLDMRLIKDVGGRWLVNEARV